MAGLVLTLSIIFVLALGGSVIRLTTRINRLENRMNIIVNNLEQNEKPLLGNVNDRPILGLNNQHPNLLSMTVQPKQRTKIPVTIVGEKHLVYADSTMEEFVKEVGHPDSTEGDWDEYRLYYMSSSVSDSVKVTFINNELDSIKSY